MPTNKQKMVFLVMLSVYAATSAYAQVESEHLQELVELSARRLVIAEQAALAKWDNGMPVEDASREDQVIGSAMKAGQSRGGSNVGVKLLHSADRGQQTRAVFTVVRVAPGRQSAGSHAGRSSQYDSCKAR